MKEVSIPAGLEDRALEIYIHNDTLRAIFRGKSMAFFDLPSGIIEAFRQNMKDNKQAFTSLQNDFDLTDENEMLGQYIKCNFGTFDASPDLTDQGKIIQECWDCGQRDTCPGEGKVCTRPGLEKRLSRKETIIFFLLIDGKIDKEIADYCKNSIATLSTEMKRIRGKLGCNNRIEVMNFAMKRKLI